MLCCILTLFSGCKEDEENPLRFYNSEYEVPMGGRRYLDWKAEMVITHLKLKTHASQAQEPKPAGAEYLPDV